MKRLRNIFLLCLNLSFFTFGQGINNYSLIKNYLLVGLEENAYKLLAEELSNSVDNPNKAETLIQVADHCLSKYYITKNNDLTSIMRAYNLYKLFLANYPNSEKRLWVSTALEFIKVQFRDYEIEDNLERKIVIDKIKQADVLVNILPPNGIKYFLDKKLDNNYLITLERYFDDVIVNYPNYEIYGYYYKIIALLSKFDERFIKENVIKIDKYTLGVLKWNQDVTKIIKDEKSNLVKYECKEFPLKNRVLEYLNYISEKYPTHELTISLYFIISKLEIDGYSKDNIHNDVVKEMLEYVLRNCHNKMSVEYFIAKEFVLANKFMK